MADIPVYENSAETKVTVTYAGQVNFSYDFLVLRGEQLAAYYTPAVGGGMVKLVYGDDYTVAGVNNPNGGAVDLVGISPAIGDEVLMRRETPIERLNDWQNEGDYKAALVNREQDTMFMIMQELARDTGEISPTVKGIHDAISKSRPGNVLGWDGSSKFAPLINSAAEAEVIAEEAQGYRNESRELKEEIEGIHGETEQLRETAAGYIPIIAGHASTASNQADRAEGQADRAELARDAAEDAVQYNYLVADYVALNAIVGMTANQRAFVRSTEHVWRYDGAAWVDDGQSPSVAKANKSYVDGIRDSLSSYDILLGWQGPIPDGTTSANSATYTFDRPFPFSSTGLVFTYYGRSSGVAYIQVVERTGTVNTIISEREIAISPGENTVVLSDLSFLGGQFPGLRCGTGLIAITAGYDGYNYWSSAAQISEGNNYTDDSLSNATFHARFEVLYQAVTADRILETQEGTEYLLARVGTDEDVERVFWLPEGTSLSSGLAAGVHTYVCAEPAEIDMELVGLDVWANGIGTAILRIYDREVNTFTQVGDDIPIVFSSTGAISITSVPTVVVRKGQYHGIAGGTASIAINTAVGAGTPYIQGSAGTFTNNIVNPDLRFELRTKFRPYTLMSRMNMLEQAIDPSDPVILLPHDTEAFHVVWMLGESHVAGRSTAFSSDIPAGRGYCYRRATGTIDHLQDPTGNDGTAISGMGLGSWGPPIGQALLDTTHGAVGAIIVNSGLGSTTVANWGAAGGAWTQAKADWDAAMAAIKMAKFPVSGVTIVVGIGSNDAAAGTDKATFNAGLLDLVERARAYVAAGEAVPAALVMTGPFADGSSAAGVLDCQQAQAELAREEPNIFIASSAPKFATERGWFMDNVHFNQAGNDAIGAGIAAVSLARGAGVYPAGLE